MKTYLLLLFVLCSFISCARKDETPNSPPNVAEEAPPHGMDCGNVGVGGRSITDANAFFVSDIPGSAIKSLTLHLTFPGGNSGIFYPQPTTLNVYICGREMVDLGTLVDTVDLPIVLTNQTQAYTWTFTGPIPIPTNCQNGHRTVGFKFSNTWTWAAVGETLNNKPNTCFLDIGNSAAYIQSSAVGNANVPQFWLATIDATP